MKLMRDPRAFNFHTSRHIMRLMGRSDDKGRKYLFSDSCYHSPMVQRVGLFPKHSR